MVRGRKSLELVRRRGRLPGEGDFWGDDGWSVMVVGAPKSYRRADEALDVLRGRRWLLLLFLICRASISTLKSCNPVPQKASGARRNETEAMKKLRRVETERKKSVFTRAAPTSLYANPCHAPVIWLAVVIAPQPTNPGYGVWPTMAAPKLCILFHSLQSVRGYSANLYLSWPLTV